VKASTAALIGAAFGVVALGLKFAAYTATNSIALYSDAIESVVSIVAALGVYLALRISARPADDDHPYGYTKVEYFSAVVEGALVIGVAFAILEKAYGGFLEPRKHLAPVLGLALSGAATAINGAWAFRLSAIAKDIRSPALIAQAKHIWADVATSVGVFIGFGLAALTGWWLLDPLLAGAVALNVLWSGALLIWQSIGALLDRAAPEPVEDTIRSTVVANSGGFAKVVRLRTRVAGAHTFVDLKLTMPGSLSVADSHAIVARMRTAIETAVEGARVAIRVEPEEIEAAA
jgi:cation diffusion facilitator family transporter